MDRQLGRTHHDGAAVFLCSTIGDEAQLDAGAGVGSAPCGMEFPSCRWREPSVDRKRSRRFSMSVRSRSRSEQLLHPPLNSSFDWCGSSGPEHRRNDLFAGRRNETERGCGHGPVVAPCRDGFGTRLNSDSSRGKLANYRQISGKQNVLNLRCIVSRFIAAISMQVRARGCRRGRGQVPLDARPAASSRPSEIHRIACNGPLSRHRDIPGATDHLHWRPL